MSVRRLSGLSAALLALVLFAACGAEEAAARLRLWTEAAELSEAPLPTDAHTVFASRFEETLDGWDDIVNPGRGPGGLEAKLERADGRALVRLTGQHGGLHTVVPVEPDTCYVFSGEVRASAIESAAADFDGARFWLAEASGAAPFAEFRTTRAALMQANWTSTSAGRQSGWQERRRVFVTTPRTRFLHVVCSLATKEDVRAGSVEFAELRLAARPLEEFWRDRLASECSERAGIDAHDFDWQRTRLVSAELGGEHRPAFVLLPGDRLRFTLPPLRDGASLTFGAGAFRPTLIEGRSSASTLRVRAAQREILTRKLDVPRSAGDARWQPFELDLSASVTELEFTLEGDAPLALGAALVHTGAPPRPGPNLLLVSIDTLRADHVGAYGYARATTPNLDRLAERGLLCRDTSAPAPYTLPSHATLLTGQFPAVHGAVRHERTLSAARSTSLAELLARSGYATQAFTAGGFVNAEFGLDRGFEGFGQIDPIRARDSHFFRTLAAKHGPELAERLLAEHGFAGVERWLRARGPEPFFLFLHTYTVHDYDTPPRFLACQELGCPRPKVALRTQTSAEAAAFTPEMRAHVQHLYDAALRYTDERLGELLALLDELGLSEDTLIVVTSDHGEEFFEHGALQHGRTLYEELLRVPLILAGPGVPARVLERPAMLVDVVPTVLARLGLARAEHVQGVDLLGRDWPARAIWSEVDDRFAHKYALREERGTKTIHGPPSAGIQFANARAWELFELAQDAHEQQDLAPALPPALEAAQRRLEQQRAALEELGNSLGAVGHGEVGASTLEQLDELGYGGG